MNKKTLLSTLWILVTLNYLFRFLFSLYYAERLQELLSGHLHGMEATQGFLLALSIMMEIPIAMILFSRLLKRRPNRILNILIPLIMGAIHLLSMSAVGVTLHFYFFGVAGIILYSSIILIAWRWKTEEVTINENK